MCTGAEQQDWLLISVPDYVLSGEDGSLRYAAWKIICIVLSRLLGMAPNIICVCILILCVCNLSVFSTECLHSSCCLYDFILLSSFLY